MPIRRTRRGTGITARRRRVVDAPFGPAERAASVEIIDRAAQAWWPARLEAIEAGAKAALAAEGLPDHLRDVAWWPDGRWQELPPGYDHKPASLRALAAAMAVRITVGSVAAVADDSVIGSDTVAGYAARLLEAAALWRAYAGRGDMDAAAGEAFKIGAMIAEAALKLGWEAPALRAHKATAAMAAARDEGNTARAQEADRRWADVRAAAAELRRRRPGLPKKAQAEHLKRALDLTAPVDTIRRRI